MLFLFSIGLTLLILLPLAKKCQIPYETAGIGSVIIGFVTALVLFFLQRNITMGYLHLFFTGIFLILFFTGCIILFRFYRDPERTPPEDQQALVSPADGRVLYVKKVVSGQVPFSVKNGTVYHLEELTNTSLLKDAFYTIGVEMSILDVHVNRVPVMGKVILSKHTPGKFLSLRREEAPVKNERLTTVVDQGHFKVGIVQIASRLVRRIQSYLEEGQVVDLGQRLGMIKFGSQVDLVIPRLNNLRIEVKPGDKVKAGVSVIARYDEHP